VAQDGAIESNDFAARLLLALNACNLSRSQLSATLGVHKSLVSRWLSGQVTPTSHNLARISAAFAKLKPGFNMTLWTAPLPEFEAFLGISTVPSAPSPTHPSQAPPDRHPAPVKSPTPPVAFKALASRQPLFWILSTIGIAMAMALGAWLLLGFGESRRTALNDRPVEKATAVIPSVAVLPFVNMSGDPAKEYLGDGLSEEILNDLANTLDLRVAARTSSFAFKGKQADIGEIARTLHVGAVLEGSVRQEGDRIRVVAQLINVADGFHLWSASYDGKLDDILSVQDQIARAIVVALTQKLAPPKPRHTIDPKAYQDYLQAQYFFNQRSGSAFRSANELLKDALARQPDFAAAYALRGHVLLLFAGEDRELQEESRQMTAAALRFEPDNQEALDTELQRALRAWDWAAADRTGHRILVQKKRNAVSFNGMAFLYQYMGFPQQALEARRHAAELDSLYFSYRNNFALSLWRAGRLPEATAAAEAALELQPGQPSVLDELCMLNALAGKIDRARDYGRQLAAISTPSLPISASNAQDRGRLIAIRQVITSRIKDCEIQIAFATLPAPKIHTLLDRIKGEEMGSSALGVLYARAGDFTRAMKLFSGAYDQRELELVSVRYNADTPKALLHDPRWIALWKRPLLVDWQWHHDRLAAELATTRSPRSD
jgi:TolB-like protein/transcriptional regulator with XRE-family HTH domain